MAFAAIYAPNFLIQAVVRGESDFRVNAIALVDGDPPLEKVVAASEAALQAGIELGMTKTQAADFSGTEICDRSREREKSAHAALLDLGWSFSPRIEDTAPDTIVLDLAGLSALFDSEEKIAERLTERAAALGLTVNVAIASLIEAAIHASRGFPGITLIPSGQESKFLEPLPLNVLSPSEETCATFDRWGIRTCKDLAALPILQISERLGQEGVRLHELARGASVRSLVLAGPAFHFEEEMELDCAVDELEPLAFVLGRLLDQLCARLTARSLAASAIHLRFKLERSWEEELRFDEQSGRWNGNGSQDSIPKTYEKTLNLPVPMRDSKMLLKLVRLHLEGNPPRAPILKIALAADPDLPRVAQGDSFAPSGPNPEKLELTIARLASLVGESNVGSPELVDTHRPLKFRMKHFIPVREDSARRKSRRTADRPNSKDSESKRKQTDSSSRKNSSKKSEPLGGRSFSSDIPETFKSGILIPEAMQFSSAQILNSDHHNKETTATALRVFRPVMPARVEVLDGKPARIWFRGVQGDVVAAAGPWRTTGDWWREDEWHQDEWDLEIRFRSSSSSVSAANRNRQREKNPNEQSGTDASRNWNRGLYRLFFDSICNAWFVRGVYD